MVSFLKIVNRLSTLNCHATEKAFCITQYAGFVAQTIAIRGVNDILINRKIYIHNHDLMVTTGADGDLGAINRTIGRMLMFRRAKDEKKIRREAVDFLLSFFIDQGAWDYVQEFSKLLTENESE